VRRAVVTGGAGFIGRWVCRALLDDGWAVTALDDLSNGSESNLAEFASDPAFDLVVGSIDDERALDDAFRERPEICLHLAARINVQHSIDDPIATYVPDVVGTLRVLERCRAARAPFLFMSSCMVYAPAGSEAIREDHPVRPASPYAASKLAGETLTVSYGLAYGHPVTVVRPFNTYGPFQRTDGEGGVVAIFCRRALAGEPVDVFGDGTQTRDLLYVADCAEFVIRAATSEAARGELLNAGTGEDIRVVDLAALIGGDQIGYRLTEHPHPQAEIARLVCDPSKARELLGWEPSTPLAEGVRRVTEWLASESAPAR
jgi:nucleoside-diphosphate-sugar epimerase